MSVLVSFCRGSVSVAMLGTTFFFSCLNARIAALLSSAASIPDGSIVYNSVYPELTFLFVQENVICQILVCP